MIHHCVGVGELWWRHALDTDILYSINVKHPQGSVRALGCELRFAAAGPAESQVTGRPRDLRRASDVKSPPEVVPRIRITAMSTSSRSTLRVVCEIAQARGRPPHHVATTRSLSLLSGYRLADGTSWHEIEPAFFHPSRSSHVFGWYTTRGS